MIIYYNYSLYIQIKIIKFLNFADLKYNSFRLTFDLFPTKKLFSLQPSLFFVNFPLFRYKTNPVFHSGMKATWLVLHLKEEVVLNDHYRKINLTKIQSMKFVKL